MIEKLITISIIFIVGIIGPIVWCSILERKRYGEKIKVRCLLTGHDYSNMVYYDEYPKAVCKTTIVQHCDRCDHRKIKIGSTVTTFIVSTKYLEEKQKPRLRVVK
jgi:hypothetical protein